MQKNVSVHAPEDAMIMVHRMEEIAKASMIESYPEDKPLEDSTEEDPQRIRRRFTKEASEKMQSTVGTFFDSVKSLLQAFEQPLAHIIKEPIHRYEHWTPEEMTELAMGYVAAFRQPSFSKLVHTSLWRFSKMASELGRELDAIAGELNFEAEHMHSPEEARYWLEHTSMYSSEAMADAVGKYFDLLRTFLKALPAGHLQEASQDLQVRLEATSATQVGRIYETELKPMTEELYAQRELCVPLASGIASLVKADQAMSSQKSTIARMRAAVPELETYVRVATWSAFRSGRRKQTDQVVSSLSSLVDYFESSLKAVGHGFHSCVGALQEVAKHKLNCTVV